MIAIASFVDWLTNSCCHLAVTGVVNRFTDFFTDGAVAGFVHRLANCVFFLTVAGLEDGFGAANRYGFAAGVVNSDRAAILLIFPDRLFDGLILGAATLFGVTEMTPGSTGFDRAAFIAVCAAIGGL
tara:strand:+ start:335 stop:715 length:381 start_codon:yes stop_codon:yes gene_type:complete